MEPTKEMLDNCLEAGRIVFHKTDKLRRTPMIVTHVAGTTNDAGRSEVTVTVSWVCSDGYPQQDVQFRSLELEIVPESERDNPMIRLYRLRHQSPQEANANATADVAAHTGPKRSLLWRSVTAAVASQEPTARAAHIDAAMEAVTSERPLLDWIISGQWKDLVKAIIEAIKLFQGISSK